jgi:hypothetical protein
MDLKDGTKTKRAGGQVLHLLTSATTLRFPILVFHFSTHYKRQFKKIFDTNWYKIPLS